MTGATRSPLVPEVPTVAEAGFADFNMDLWTGLLAPAGTPKEIISRLNAEVSQILSVPETRNLLAQRGVDAAPGTPAVRRPHRRRPRALAEGRRVGPHQRGLESA